MSYGICGGNRRVLSLAYPPPHPNKVTTHRLTTKSRGYDGGEQLVVGSRLGKSSTSY